MILSSPTFSWRSAPVRSLVVSLRIGAGPGRVVAVILDRTCDLVAGLLGVLLAGGAYLPIDPAQPARRTKFMITDSGATVLLTRTGLVSDPVALEDTDIAVVTVDAPGPEYAAPEALPQVENTDLAYVIYTSGSTGTPKGVLVEHGSVAKLLAGLFPGFGVAASDTVLAVASYTFDMSVGDIFGTLCAGARLVLASSAEAAEPHALGALIDQCGATYLSATPTTWSALLDIGWVGSSRLTVLSGGEPLPEVLAGRLLERCAAVWNTYGPTETTDVANCDRVVAGAPITVGHPLPGARVYVLDQQFRPLPAGVPGEIVIGGAGVARGYLNRPVEMAERFAADPFIEGGRVYRSGDRGRFLADGRLQHLGRYDDQLKIRGFRIEPAEIEAVLAEHPGVSAGVVVARATTQEDRQLVAYVVDSQVPDVELRAWVRARLPGYMVPAAIVHLAALPTTPGGKVERAALPAPATEHGAVLIGQPPRSPTEKRLADLWSAVLGTDVVDVHADFFDVGGHSLLAARLITDTEAEFGRSVDLSEFVKHGTTIAGLATMLTSDPAAAEYATSTRPPLFFVYPDPSSAVSVRHLVRAWGAEQPVYPLVPAQPNGRFDPAATVEDLAQPLIAVVRQLRPQGPYAFAGFSLGGLIAYEVGRQLAEAGEQVDWLGVFDTSTPAVAELRRRLSPWEGFTRLRRRSRKVRWVKYREVGVRAVRRCLHVPSPHEHFDYSGAVAITCAYAQQGHELPVDLFVTADSITDLDSASLGWSQYHRGPLRVHPLPGDHFSLLDQPQIGEVAGLMLASLRHVEG